MQEYFALMLNEKDGYRDSETLTEELQNLAFSRFTPRRHLHAANKHALLCLVEDF